MTVMNSSQQVTYRKEKEDSEEKNESGEGRAIQRRIKKIYIYQRESSHQIEENWARKHLTSQGNTAEADR